MPYSLTLHSTFPRAKTAQPQLSQLFYVLLKAVELHFCHSQLNETLNEKDTQVGLKVVIINVDREKRVSLQSYYGKALVIKYG